MSKASEPDKDETSAPKDEPGIALGIFLIGLLVIPMIAASAFGLNMNRPDKPGIDAVVAGTIGMMWGAMFLLSYFFSRKTFFFRALIWFCEHGSSPNNRKMAFFYAALCAGLGAMTFLVGIGWL
jgi:hypothetical protein